MFSRQGRVRLVRLNAQNYHVRFIETLERYAGGRQGRVASCTQVGQVGAEMFVAIGGVDPAAPTTVLLQVQTKLAGKQGQK